MRTIKLTTPQHTQDTETKTEYDVAKISGVRSVTGSEEEPGTHFWVAGSFERQFCVEPARQVRQMIEDALNSEEVRLGIEAMSMLVRGAQSSDGAMHFIEGDGFLGVVVADFRPEPFRGRARSLYEHARDELVRQGFIVPKGGGLYQITQRGYAMADFLAKEPSDREFHGHIRLPARSVGSESTAPVFYSQNTYHQEHSMNFNQTNINKGDVNNAISEKGNVVQTTGSARTAGVAAAASEQGNVVQTSGERNRLQVERTKAGFWSEVLTKLGPAWKWIKALFTGGA